MQENWQFLATMSVSATITTRYQIMPAAVDAPKIATTQTVVAAPKAPQVNPPAAIRLAVEDIWLRPFPVPPVSAATQTATASDYAPPTSALR